MSKINSLLAAASFVGMTACAGQQVRPKEVFHLSQSDCELPCETIRGPKETPYNLFTILGIIFHEIGHNLGLNHTAKDNPADIMISGISSISIISNWSFNAQNAKSLIHYTLGDNGLNAGAFQYNLTNTRKICGRSFTALEANPWEGYKKERLTAASVN